MKRLTLSTILIFISGTLWADGYSSANLTLEIHTKDGELITGYTIYSPDHLLRNDSICSTSYLISKLKSMSPDDSILYFVHRFKYGYPNSERDSIYVYLAPKKIAPSDIHKITVLKKITSGSYHGIANPLEPEDTTWMQTAIVDMVTISGPYCSFDFFIHEKSAELYRIIDKLKPLVEEYDNAITKEENLNQAELNTKMDRLFKEAGKFETVAISTCVE